MSTEQSAKALDLDAIEAAARACTALNFDSAKDEQPQSGSLECPHCDGTGSVELEADYCNFDGKALGVQFYGIGPEFGAAERFVRAANPAAVLELVRLARLSTPPQSSAQGAADCAAIGFGACSIGPHGPKGSLQCAYCGEEPSQAPVEPGSPAWREELLDSFDEFADESADGVWDQNTGQAALWIIDILQALIKEYGHPQTPSRGGGE